MRLVHALKLLQLHQHPGCKAKLSCGAVVQHDKSDMMRRLLLSYCQYSTVPKLFHLLFRLHSIIMLWLFVLLRLSCIVMIHLTLFGFTLLC